MTPGARRLAPVAIVAVAAFVLVFSRLLPLGQSLWADEIKSITAYIRPGPVAIYDHYLANDHILFELLTWASTAVTGERSAAAYRFWGVAPGLAAGAILTWWLWRRVDPWVAAVFALIATASPIYYTLCVDARGYGLAFLAASCTLIGADSYSRTSSKCSLGLFGVAAVGGIWSLPAFALPVTAMIALLIVETPARRGPILVTAGLVASASLVLYAPVLPQVLTASRQRFGQPLPWYGFASGPFTDLVAPEVLVAVHGLDPTSALTLAPGASGPVPGTSGWATWSAGVVVLVGFATTVRRNRFLALACLGPALFTYTALDVGQAHTVNRFTSFLLLPLLALSAIGIVTIAKRIASQRGLAPTIVGLAAVGFAAFLFIRTDDMLRALLAAPYENDQLVADIVRTAAIEPVVTNFDGGDTGYYLGRWRASRRSTSQLEALFCSRTDELTYLDELLAPSQPPTTCLRRRGAIEIRIPQRHATATTAGSPFTVWLVRPRPGSLPFATRRSGSRIHSLRGPAPAIPESQPASTSCTNRTTIVPSPTAPATRLAAPARTSPAANTPGRVVSSRCGSRSDSGQRRCPS